MKERLYFMVIVIEGGYFMWSLGGYDNLQEAIDFRYERERMYPESGQMLIIGTRRDEEWASDELPEYEPNSIHEL